MRRRDFLMTTAAVLPLVACGGSLPPVLTQVARIPEAVAEVADLVRDIGEGLQGGLAPLLQGIPAVAEVTALLATINGAVRKVQDVASAVSAAPIVNEVSVAVSRVHGLVQTLGPRVKSLVDAAISLVPTLQGMVGIRRAGRVHVPVPPDQARMLLRDAAGR